MASAEPLRVEVVFCPKPGEADRTELQLPPGATLADAIHASGLLGRHRLVTTEMQTGIWCRAQGPATLLRDRDRVEVYRPLLVDPKEARRQRYKRHKEEAARRAAR